MQGIESAYSIRAQEEKIPQKKAGYMTQVPYLPKSDAFFLDQPAGPYMTNLPGAKDDEKKIIFCV
jgi:hypothetical protein